MLCLPTTCLPRSIYFAEVWPVERWCSWMQRKDGFPHKSSLKLLPNNAPSFPNPLTFMRWSKPAPKSLEWISLSRYSLPLLWKWSQGLLKACNVSSDVMCETLLSSAVGGVTESIIWVSWVHCWVWPPQDTSTLYLKTSNYIRSLLAIETNRFIVHLLLNGSYSCHVFSFEHPITYITFVYLLTCTT